MDVSKKVDVVHRETQKKAKLPMFVGISLDQQESRFLKLVTNTFALLS